MTYPYYTQGPQNGGLVRIRDEAEVVNYPVAPGYSVIFIDEGNTHLYVKTAGLSQFDQPTVEKYKLTKETTEPAQAEYVTRADFEELKALVISLKGEETNE